MQAVAQHQYWRWPYVAGDEEGCSIKTKVCLSYLKVRLMERAREGRGRQKSDLTARLRKAYWPLTSRAFHTSFFFFCSFYFSFRRACF